MLATRLADDGFYVLDTYPLAESIVEPFVNRANHFALEPA